MTHDIHHVVGLSDFARDLMRAGPPALDDLAGLRAKHHERSLARAPFSFLGFLQFVSGLHFLAGSHTATGLHSGRGSHASRGLHSALGFFYLVSLSYPFFSIGFLLPHTVQTQVG